MKMTRRNFISASAAAMLACGASLSAHAAENTTENGLNFITDIFKDPTQPGETEGATTITAEANAEWYDELETDKEEYVKGETVKVTLTKTANGVTSNTTVNSVTATPTISISNGQVTGWSLWTLPKL